MIAMEGRISLKSFLTGTFLVAFTNGLVDLTNWIVASDCDKLLYLAVLSSSVEQMNPR